MHMNLKHIYGQCYLDAMHYAYCIVDFEVTDAGTSCYKPSNEDKHLATLVLCSSIVQKNGEAAA